MGGTNNPDATYIADITQRYLDPFGDLPHDPSPVRVHTPEQFFPVFGSQTFDDSVAEGVLNLQDAIDANIRVAGDRVIIVGYSQSGRIATIAGPIRKSSDAKTVSAQADTTPTSVPGPKEPDRPKVRGPIEFDSQKTPTESPPAPSGEQSATDETSAPETNSKTASDSTNSPGSENKDAAQRLTGWSALSRQIHRSVDGLGR